MRPELQLWILQQTPLRILVSGARGFIGKPLVQSLEASGHEVVRLVRSPEEGAILWDPETGTVQKSDFEDFDAVIHLSGEKIAGRWTKEKKRKILCSRTLSTFLLAHVLAQTHRPPKVFISPSAVGYYGDAGDRFLTEESPMGVGFLPVVCHEWEKAANAMVARGCRVVHPRLGVVMGKGGGALERLLPLYRMGLGGRLGSGEQWVSWVALEDVLSSLEFCLSHERLEGAINVVSPHPVHQADFSKSLATHLHRMALLPEPAWLLHLILGQMADELLLSSARVVPAKLEKAGFSFQFQTLDSTLQHVLD